MPVCGKCKRHRPTANAVRQCYGLPPRPQPAPKTTQATETQTPTANHRLRPSTDTLTPSAQTGHLRIMRQTG